MPFISRCAFCDVPYAVIAKTETFTEDQRFIGQLAGVQFENIQKHASGGGDTKELARRYFGLLSRRAGYLLYRLYQVDFQMFGYSPQLYLKYAKQNTNLTS